MDIELVPWREEYADAFFRLTDDPALYENMSDDFPRTREDCRALVAAFAAGGEGQRVRAITVQGAVMGCAAAFFGTGLDRRSGELAYWLGREYRGRGVMTEALRRFSDELLGRDGLRRLYARPFARNMASRRCLEKAGFRLEGLLRAAASKGDAVLDVALYARVWED